MLENSKDVLNIVLAFCVLWFTVFLCWMIYYFAMILKRIYQVTETFTKTLEAMEKFFDKAQEKVNSFGSTFGALVELGKKGFDYVQEKREKKSSKSSSKKNNAE